MNTPRLAIGCAAFQESESVWFTVQALRMYHPETLSDCEFILVDNHGRGPHSEALMNFASWLPNHNLVTITSVQGTAWPREAIFKAATAPYVLVIDPHVFIVPGAIAKLLDYYEAHPDTKDLLHGPMLSDGGDIYATHMNPIWRAEMWGVWGRAFKAPDGLHVTPIEIEEGTTGVLVTLMGQRRIDFPEFPWPGHEAYLEAQGFKCPPSPRAPFEIPGHGMGLFSCRKDAWVGFNPHWTGFGGEEMQTHEKVRQAGGKVLCLPWLRWLHKFMRPNGATYTTNPLEKFRNYVIGHAELGLPLLPVFEHFGQWLTYRDMMEVARAALPGQLSVSWRYEVVN